MPRNKDEKIINVSGYEIVPEYLDIRELMTNHFFGLVGAKFETPFIKINSPSPVWSIYGGGEKEDLMVSIRFTDGAHASVGLNQDDQVLLRDQVITAIKVALAEKSPQSIDFPPVLSDKTSGEIPEKSQKK